MTDGKHCGVKSTYGSITHALVHKTDLILGKSFAKMPQHGYLKERSYVKLILQEVVECGSLPFQPMQQFQQQGLPIQIYRTLDHCSSSWNSKRKQSNLRPKRKKLGTQKMIIVK